MRRVLYLLPLALLLAAGLAVFGMPAATALDLPWLGRATAPEGPRLRTALVDRGTVTAAVAASGTVNPLVTVAVGSQLSGQIRELLADFNTRVRAGQPVARLDTQQLEARRAAAQADVQAAEVGVLVARAAFEKSEADAAAGLAQLRAAEAEAARDEAALRDAEYEARRTEELRRGGTGAVRDAVRAGFTVEKARADLANARALVAQTEAQRRAAEAAARTARAQVQAAEAALAQRVAQLRQVEVDLSFTTIRSPIDGVVISRNVDLGQTVAASFQAPVLFTIAASLDEMEVWATVDEADIGRVRPGQEVPFTVAAFPGETLPGRVKEIRLAAVTISNVVTYTVVVSVPNPGGRLLPGMTATLRIVTDHRPDAVRVPNAALRWRPRGEAQGAAAAGGQIEQALREMQDLTPQQEAGIAAAQAEARERIDAIPRNAEGRQGQVTAIRQRLLTRLNAILTPQQRLRLAEARGGRPGTATVWVAEGEGPPRPVPVRIGATDANHTEIMAGDLQPGQAVVVGQERAAATQASARPF